MRLRLTYVRTHSEDYAAHWEDDLRQIFTTITRSIAGVNPPSFWRVGNVAWSKHDLPLFQDNGFMPEDMPINRGYVDIRTADQTVKASFELLLIDQCPGPAAWPECVTFVTAD